MRVKGEFCPGKVRSQVGRLHVAAADAGEDRVGGRALGELRGVFVVGVEDHGAARIQRFHEHAFLQRDRLARAHEFDVGKADVRDDRHVRHGERGERRDLARMVHADLEDTDLVAAARAQHRERESDVVVEIPLGLRDLEVSTEHARGEILRARLAVRSCERHDLQGEAAAIRGCELLKRTERVGDDDHAEVRRQPLGRMPDDRRERAALRRLRHEFVRVESFPAQRDEKIAGLERTRIRADALDRGRRVASGQPALRPACDFFERRRVHGYRFASPRFSSSAELATATSSNGTV